MHGEKVFKSNRAQINTQNWWKVERKKKAFSSAPTKTKIFYRKRQKTKWPIIAFSINFDILCDEWEHMVLFIYVWGGDEGNKTILAGCFL